MTRTIAVAVAFTLAPVAFAQTYIVPDGDCGAITLHATRGAVFPATGEVIAADQVAAAYVSNSPSSGMNPEIRPHREAMKLAAGARSLDFTTNVRAEDGVVMAGVDFKPAIAGNETRTEHAKTLMFCGATAPLADWQRSADLGLEIYPQEWNGSRPRLKAGDSIWFIAIDKTTKTLLRDLPMQLYRAGAGLVGTGTPNRIGGMAFSYPEPGWYMLVSTYRRPDPQRPGNVLVDTSTLTFEVK